MIESNISNLSQIVHSRKNFVQQYLLIHFSFSDMSEIVVGYLDPLTTQDLKSSGFPVVLGRS
jgi:hypothetical protein